MELLGIENLDLENNFIEVLFDGLFTEGFYVTTEYDYDKDQVEHKDEETNCIDYYAACNITFWDFKIFNVENELITINDRELKKIKELVEFKLIDLLSDELNNN
tara:strand:- start:1705 stop:2016 length:312 start_codon:yes stop_codon:yes gene_type:complete